MLKEKIDKLNDLDEAISLIERRLEDNSDFKALQRIKKEREDAYASLDVSLRECTHDVSEEYGGYKIKKYTGSRKNILWKINEIEKQSWASAVLIKDVNTKVFDALVKGKVIDSPEDYQTIEEKNFPVVSIKKVEG